MWGIETAVNFINVKRANFLYESLFWQLFWLRFGFDERTKAHSYVKFARLTLMKLTTGRRERFTSRCITSIDSSLSCGSNSYERKWKEGDCQRCSFEKKTYVYMFAFYIYLRPLCQQSNETNTKERSKFIWNETVHMITLDTSLKLESI